MDRHLLYLYFVFFSYSLYSQDSLLWKAKIRTADKWAAAVNKFVGPQYVLFKDYNYNKYAELDLGKHGIKEKEIVVAVSDTTDSKTGGKIIKYLFLPRRTIN